MKRTKDDWDIIYGNIPDSAQTLGDNAARFRKDKAKIKIKFERGIFQRDSLSSSLLYGPYTSFK